VTGCRAQGGDDGGGRGEGEPAVNESCLAYTGKPNARKATFPRMPRRFSVHTVTHEISSSDTRIFSLSETAIVRLYDVVRAHHRINSRTVNG
jgi:hypothetical protein